MAVMAAGPWVSRIRVISPATRSRASSQEMRTYSSLPRSSGCRSPLGSKFLRFNGYWMRFV